MTSKKKLIIAITSLSLVAFVAVISIVLVLAALNATVTSGITIKYTAYNIDAEIYGAYISTGWDREENLYVDEAKTKTMLEFNPTEKSGIEKSFQPTGDVELGPNEKFIILYMIKNRDQTNPLYLVPESNFLELENFDIEMHISSTQLSDPIEGEYNNIDLPEYTIAPNGYLYVYIRAAVEKDTVDAVFDCDIGYVLSSHSIVNV